MLPHRLIAALRGAEHWLDSEFGLNRESTIQARWGAVSSLWISMDLWTIAKLDDAVGFPPCRILDLNAEYRACRSEYVASLSMKKCEVPPVSAAPVSHQIHGFFPCAG
jgi:hypothetical protein